MSAPAVPPVAAIDEARLLRARRRHAAGHAAAARVPREIAGRLLEHLLPIRREPAHVLDLGAGDGFLTEALEGRYPRARVTALEPCLPLLGSRPRRLRERLLGGGRRLCAGTGALPLAGASTDMVCSNLALSGSPDLPAVLAECRRVLRHGGVLMLSVLGPDSLVELRAAWQSVDGYPHVHPFPDMHDVGDALVGAGFSDVVVDVERLTVEFHGFMEMLRELRAAGGGNSLHGRCQGLTTPRRLQAVREALMERTGGRDDRLTAEVVYAHAWAVDAPGVAVAAPRLTPSGGPPRSA